MIFQENDFTQLYEELCRLYEASNQASSDFSKQHFLTCNIAGNRKDYALLYTPGLLKLCQDSFKKVLGADISRWPCEESAAEMYSTAWQAFLSTAGIKGELRTGNARWLSSAWQERLRDSFLSLETSREISTLTGWYSYSELITKMLAKKKKIFYSEHLQEIGYDVKTADFLAGSGVYAIKNAKTGQLYIGKSYSAGGNIAERLFGHRRPNDSKALYLAISANIENFEWAVLESSVTSDKNFNTQEAFYIEQYKTLSNLFDFNMKPGGDDDRDLPQRSTDPTLVLLISGLLSYLPSPHGNPYARSNKYRAGINYDVIRAYDLAFVPREVITASGESLPPGIDYARAVLISMLEQDVLDPMVKDKLLSCQEFKNSLSGQLEADSEEIVSTVDGLLDEPSRLLFSVYIRYNFSLPHSTVCDLVPTEFDKILRTRGSLFSPTHGNRARQAICAAISSLKQNPDQYLSRLIWEMKHVLNKTVNKEQLLQFFTDFEVRLKDDNLKLAQITDDFRVPLAAYLWFTSGASTYAGLFKDLTVNLSKPLSDEFCRDVRGSFVRNNTHTLGIRNTMRKFAEHFSEVMSCSYEFRGKTEILQGELLRNTLKFYLHLWIKYLETGDVGNLDQYALEFKSSASSLPDLAQLLKQLQELESSKKKSS